MFGGGEMKPLTKRIVEQSCLDLLIFFAGMFPVTPGRLDRNKQQSINLDAITSFFYGKKVVLF
jgi:hypothetical protein